MMLVLGCWLAYTGILVLMVALVFCVSEVASNLKKQNTILAEIERAIRNK